uniref:hypothetical protein n=1 Tax=Yersinia pestis TaxID=632 RepID=UPI0005776228
MLPGLALPHSVAPCWFVNHGNWLIVITDLSWSLAYLAYIVETLCPALCNPRGLLLGRQERPG